jgi:phosphoglycolate phosphatase
VHDQQIAGRWRAVLFDLDGTLIDPRRGILGSLRAALRAVNVVVPSDDVLASHIGPPLPVGMRALGVPEAALDEAVAAYRGEFVSIGAAGATVHAGIPALLDDVAAAGTTLAVATSKPAVIAQVVLEEQHLAGHFDVVAGADLDERNSAKETVIARALEGLGSPPGGSVVMVGDRSHDVLGARSHGIHTAAVTWGFAGPGELDACAPRWRVRGVDELRHVLLSPAP